MTNNFWPLHANPSHSTILNSISKCYQELKSIGKYRSIVILYLMKIEYSWVYKGDTETIRNLGFSSSVSMISAINFYGSILPWLTTRSINSAIFCEYVKSLKKLIISKLKIKFNKELIIMDNQNNINLNIWMNYSLQRVSLYILASL